MGNPHTVVPLASFEDLEGLDLTRAPEVDPAPSHGSNVEFVAAHEPLVREGVGRARMRVHERGVGRPSPAARARAPWRWPCARGPARAAPTRGSWRSPAASSAWTSSPTRTAPSTWCSCGPAELVFDGELTV